MEFLWPSLASSLLVSDWSLHVTWPGYCPLIGHKMPDIARTPGSSEGLTNDNWGWRENTRSCSGVNMGPDGILASDWSTQITWRLYWPLIGHRVPRGLTARGHHIWWTLHTIIRVTHHGAPEGKMARRNFLWQWHIFKIRRKCSELFEYYKLVLAFIFWKNVFDVEWEGCRDCESKSKVG